MSSVSTSYRGKSVRVFRLDRAEVLGRLERRAADLVAADAEIVEVRLFGSLARGGGGPGSDADLLVVMGSSPHRFLDRIPPLLKWFAGVGVGCDLLAYTQEEWEALRRSGSALVEAVEREGRVLAQRAPGHGMRE